MKLAEFGYRGVPIYRTPTSITKVQIPYTFRVYE
jgi:hypothetical protein